MSETTDHSNAIIRPPLAWGLAFLAGLGLERIYSFPFLPRAWPHGWIGGLIFALGFALAVSAIVTFQANRTAVPTNRPTRTVVQKGPYRVTRNPIYSGMFVGQLGLAVGFDSLWMVATLVPFYLVIRYGVVAREEAYLERKFGDGYRRYKERVRRWI